MLILAASPWNEFTIRHKNIFNCPKSKKTFLFALHSYCPARDIFKELTKLSQHATFQSRVTVSVLEIVDVHLSEKKCFMVIAEYIFMQIDQLLYKYSFLRYWFLFKINGIKGLLAECLKIWRLNLGSCNPKYDVFG